MQFFTANEMDFLVEGCQITGVDLERQSSVPKAIRTFKSFFGCSPSICCELWNRLLLQNLHPNGTRPLYLLCALLFLKQYNVDGTNSRLTNLSGNTFRKWCKIYVYLIANHIPAINFENRRMGSNPAATCFMSLDGTDCPIEEPHPFSPRWFSHKFNGAGLRYEVGVSINHEDIVWINGPFPCGEFNDLSIAREELIYRLDADEMVIADKGYHDDRFFINPLGYPQSAVAQKQIMAKHENVNKRLKEFEVLKAKFRHNIIEMHQRCFYAVATITQLKIQESKVN